VAVENPEKTKAYSFQSKDSGENREISSESSSTSAGILKYLKGEVIPKRKQ